MTRAGPQPSQAWHEWLPTRTGTDPLKIYRSFEFGNLLTLHMLDTRVIGRDAPITRDQYLAGAAADPNRQLLGAEQAGWLAAGMQTSGAIWQVLGQQVLMGRMQIPLSVFDNFTEGSITEYLQALDTAEAARTERQRVLLSQPRIGYDLGDLGRIRGRTRAGVRHRAHARQEPGRAVRRQPQRMGQRSQGQRRAQRRRRAGHTVGHFHRAGD